MEKSRGIRAIPKVNANNESACREREYRPPSAECRRGRIEGQLWKRVTRISRNSFGELNLETTSARALVSFISIIVIGVNDGKLIATKAVTGWTFSDHHWRTELPTNYDSTARPILERFQSRVVQPFQAPRANPSRGANHRGDSANRYSSLDSGKLREIKEEKGFRSPVPPCRSARCLSDRRFHRTLRIPFA